MREECEAFCDRASELKTEWLQMQIEYEDIMVEEKSVRDQLEEVKARQAARKSSSNAATVVAKVSRCKDLLINRTKQHIAIAGASSSGEPGSGSLGRRIGLGANADESFSVQVRHQIGTSNHRLAKG